MGNENTAIHDLLAGVSRKAIADDPDDDILFAGSRKPDAPRPAVTGRAGMFTLPPPPPEPVAPSGQFMAPPPMRSAAGTLPPPTAGAPMAGAPMAGVPMSVPVITTAPGMPTIAMSALPPQYAMPPQHAMPLPGARRHAVEATTRVSKSSAWSVTRMPQLKLYAIPVALSAVVVVLLTLYLTSSGGANQAAAQVAASPKRTVAELPAPPPAPAPAPVLAEPTAQPVVSANVEPAAEQPAAEAPRPVEQKDVIVPPTVVAASAFSAKREPTIATVTATPIETEAAPAAAPVEPTVAVEQAASPRVAVKAKKSKRELARERRAAKRAGKRAKSRVAAAEPVRKSKPATDKRESLNGNGALAITSSAPREVWVDGRNSKRMTPLRVLLKPGKHTVTLFDKQKGKAKSFDVEIKANTTTKVAK